MSDEPPGEPGALLHPTAAARAFSVARHASRESLAPFVDYLWTVCWEVDGTYR